MLDETDPLVYSGVQIEPSVENRLPVTSALPVVFRMYNIPGTPDQWNLVARAKITDEQGKELALDPILMKKAISPLGNGMAAVGLALPFRNAAPGKYRLTVQITETASSASTTLQSDLEYVK